MHPFQTVDCVASLLLFLQRFVDHSTFPVKSSPLPPPALRTALSGNGAMPHMLRGRYFGGSKTLMSQKIPFLLFKPFHLWTCSV